MTSSWDGPGYYAAQLAPETVRTDWTMPVARAGIVPPRPLQLGDVLGGAFRAVRFAPLTMFGLTLVVLMVAQLAGTGAGYVLGRQFGLSLVPYGDSDFATTSLLSWSTVAGTLTNYLTSILVGMGLMYATFHAVAARKVTPREALRHMFARFWAALAYCGLIAVAAVVVAAAVFALAAPAFGRGGSGGDAVIALAVIVALPGFVWLNTKLLLVPCVISVERLGPFRAIARSWRLTRGQFWRLFGINMLAGLLVSMAAGTVSTVFSFVGLMLTVEQGGELGLLAMTTASNLSATVLSLPLTTAVATLLYTDARIRQEGYDLQLTETLYG
jgi:hypothetical protein